MPAERICLIRDTLNAREVEAANQNFEILIVIAEVICLKPVWTTADHGVALAAALLSICYMKKYRQAVITDMDLRERFDMRLRLIFASRRANFQRRV
jgi:hypothetical protein